MFQVISDYSQWLFPPLHSTTHPPTFIFENDEGEHTSIGTSNVKMVEYTIIGASYVGFDADFCAHIYGKHYPYIEGMLPPSPRLLPMCVSEICLYIHFPDPSHQNRCPAPLW